jgi:signal transduction histidine kinase
MTVIFNPAIHLINKLTYAKKIILFSLIFFLTTSILLIYLYVELNRTIQTANQELAGIDQIIAVHDVIQLAQQSRGLSSAVVAGDASLADAYITKSQETTISFDEMISKLDPELLAYTQKASLEKLWKDVRSQPLTQSPEESYSFHTKFIHQLHRFLLEVADHYEWTTDPEHVSRYLIDSIVTTFPAFIESIGRLRAKAVSGVVINSLSEEQSANFIILEYEINRTFDDVAHSLQKINQYVPELKKNIESGYSSLKVIKDHALEEKGKVVSNIGSNKISPKEIFNIYTQIVNDSYNLLQKEFVYSFEQNLYSRIKKSKKQLFLAGAVSVTLLIILLYLYMSYYYSVISNFFKITHALKQYTKGELGGRVDINTNDELEEIGSALNIMADNLKKTLSENKKIARVAVQASKAKSEFLSSMSHELRTPMNAVLGFAQILKFDTENSLTKEQLDAVEFILVGGNDLLKLINEVLDLSKIETGHTDLFIEAVKVDEIFSLVATTIQQEAKRSSITIDNKTATQPSSLCLQADYNKLKQVILNFSSNAIKYNSEQGVVTFSCEELDTGSVRLSVADTGDGVSEDDFSDLFEPFNRLSKSNSTISGTGIGLTISKKLVDLMGGRIGVFNNPGKGLTFWVEFEKAL